MKKFHFLSILIAASFSTPPLHGQEIIANSNPKTIALEEMIGDKRQFLQLMVNKIFVERKKIGLMSIASYADDYIDKFNNNEFQNTSLIYHHLFKGISINSGASFTCIEGLKNFIGLQYMFQTKTFSLLYMPSYYFIKGNRIANLALIEYKPVLNRNWSIYTRLQMHYNHDLENRSHFRSYVYSRLGLTYQYFSFGLAHNFDRYGANKNSKINAGVFLKLTF